MTYYHCYDRPGGNAVAGQTFQRQINSHPDALMNIVVPETHDFYSLTADMAALHLAAAAKGIRPNVTATIGQSGEGRELHTLVLGANAHATKVLVCGCHHAREWISVEVPYLLAEYLVNTYPAPGTNLNAMTHEQRRVKHLVDNRQIWFVPMVNPDGHEYTMQERMWRKTRTPENVAFARNLDRHWETVLNLDRYYTHQAKEPNTNGTLAIFGAHQLFVRNATWQRSVINCPGVVTITDVARGYGTCTNGHAIRRKVVAPATYHGVDINRNYNTAQWGQEHGLQWTVHVSHEPANDSYCGPNAASEAETVLLQNLIGAQQFTSVLSYHSYSELLLFPDGVWANRAANAHGEVRAIELAARMSDLIYASRQHRYVVAFTSGLYAAPGDITDYAYEAIHCSRAYTPELAPAWLPPPPNSHPHGFSRLPRTEIQPVFEENLAAALALINCAGYAGDSAAATHAPPANPVAAQTIQIVENCWKVFNNWPNPPNL